MTYVEVIVVLSIFSILSGIAVYNHQAFQSKVDIKNLANDIALMAVEMQKRAIFGNMPTLAQQALISSTWNPAYGLYFNMADNNSFFRFTDVDNNAIYNGTNCAGECIEEINLTKSNTIASLEVYYQGSPTPDTVTELTFVFTRPSGGAAIRTTPAAGPNISHAQINLTSPNGTLANIKVYASGRVQIN